MSGHRVTQLINELAAIDARLAEKEVAVREAQRSIFKMRNIRMKLSNELDVLVELDEIHNRQVVLKAEQDRHWEVMRKNRVDMLSPLVDENGDPIINIDVYAVTKARKHINLLAVEEEELANRKRALHERLHDGAAGRSSSEIPVVPRSSNNPFMRISSVAPQSPAAEEGIKEGDEIVQFGTLSGDNFENVENVVKMVNDSSEWSIPVTILRTIELKPRLLYGQGFLGCTFE